MKETTGKDNEFFIIFHKAYSLHKQLKQYPHLLTSIQDSTSNLALRLQKAKTVTEPSFSPLLVPSKWEAEFRYFVDTPLCYLKGLRMSFITSLFEGLGIEVDKKREGSRVHFAYKDNKTSIHIHDKENGEVDSGAISDLRKYLINAINWVTPNE